MQSIDNFFEQFQVPVTPPEAWGTFHVLFFVVGVLAAMLLAYSLRGTTERQNKRVLLALGLFLLACEIFKQGFQYFAVEYTRYPFGIFPFHICSTPMYLCIIAALLPENKLRQALFDYMGTYGFLGGFLSFFEPSGLTHGYWVQTLHSFLWHLLLIFLALYLGASGRVGREKGGFRRAAVVFLSLATVAFAINLIFYDASRGTINMFFVGPATQGIVVFSAISARFGWYVNLPLYLSIYTLAAWFVYTLAARYNRGRIETDHRRALEAH